MNRRFWLGLFSLFLFGAVVSNAGDKRESSSQEERAQFLRMTSELEEKPLGAEAKAMRAQMLKWLTAVPDISVKVCPELSVPLIGVKTGHATELLMQAMFANAASQIQDPSTAKDQATIQIAGLLGMLRAYEAILVLEPNAHLRFLDELLSKRSAGTLQTWVRENAAKCK